MADRQIPNFTFTAVTGEADLTGSAPEQDIRDDAAYLSTAESGFSYVPNSSANQSESRWKLIAPKPRSGSSASGSDRSDASPSRIQKKKRSTPKRAAHHQGSSSTLIQEWLDRDPEHREILRSKLSQGNTNTDLAEFLSDHGLQIPNRVHGDMRGLTHKEVGRFLRQSENADLLALVRHRPARWNRNQQEQSTIVGSPTEATEFTGPSGGNSNELGTNVHSDLLYWGMMSGADVWDFAPCPSNCGRSECQALEMIMGL